jgi:hypothetical protein
MIPWHYPRKLGLPTRMGHIARQVRRSLQLSHQAATILGSGISGVLQRRTRETLLRQVYGCTELHTFEAEDAWATQDHHDFRFIQGCVHLQAS